MLGRVRTSTSFPSLCSAKVEDNVTVGIESTVVLNTVDYHGNQRKTGGDPIEAELISSTTQQNIVPLEVTDNNDGTYTVKFRPPKPGRYSIRIYIFERSIKDSPLFFDVSEHNNPVKIYGCYGSGKDEFVQPVAVAVDENDQSVYVLDTGNSRIKVLNEELEFVKHITNEGLLGRSCTGLTLSSNGLIVVNWRNKSITEMTKDGETIKTFTYNAFQEPIDVALDKNYGHILVADNGMNCVFVFDADGRILFQVGKKGMFCQISSVTVGPNSEIVVADLKIQVFSAKGDFMEVIRDEGKSIIFIRYVITFLTYIFTDKGRYGGIAIDSNGRILTSRSEQKGKNYIQLLSLIDRNVNNHIDSYENKLKRPSGVAVASGNHVIVVDLGNNCIKKYRYW